ncbi:MAG: hypothetical protein AUH85_14410 [Chloroflexi bacterium 13_1_40CM_4_68_4]|nr:MAG: hypothetical protein AUH85_14410 [Chloroflexi bacterium 13_1_40CM_4_68_4]
MAPILLALLVVGACEGPAPRPEDAARAYGDAWQRADYAAMYDLLTPEAKARLAKGAFVGRYQRSAEEMSLDAVEVGVGVSVPEQDASHKPIDGRASVPLAVHYKTRLVDPFSRAVGLGLVRQPDKSWRVEWRPTAILPELTGDRLVRMTRVDPSRGRILARDGTELATFGDGFEIGVVPGQIKDESGMLRSLGLLVKLPETEIKKRYANGQPDWFMPIRVMGPDTSQDVRQRLAVIEGVQLRPVRVRSYPQRTLAAHVVGYVGEITAEELGKLGPKGYREGDRIGKTGIEQTLETVLAGNFGWRLGVVEPDETVAALLAERTAQPGLDVVLSLDIATQRAAAAAAAAEQKAAVVVEDPATGEVLALVSQPTFDPNAFAFDDAAAIAGYLNDARKPLFTRATFGQYPTGSSFKMVTASAALREGALQAGEKVSCPVVWTGYGPQWRQENHETADLGPIDLHTALARSCNTFFYELGKRLNDKDPHLLPDTAKSFGLGKATDIDFVLEAEGLVPTPEWKAAQFPNDAVSRSWLPGDATNLAIGQGYLLATPLQMANYVSAVLNDGTVLKPRLVLRMQSRDGTVVKSYERAELGKAGVKPEHLVRIRDGMRGVVADPAGTAYFPFLGFSVPVLGKSGTAQTTSGSPDAWFVGGAPYDGATIAIATLVEEKAGIQGSQDAARMARKTLAAALKVAP